MGKKKSFLELVGSLGASARIELAKKVIEELTRRIELPLALHEANRIVGYSDALSSQIPESYAGHAFRDFTTAMFRYEIVQLLALWERPEGTLDRTVYSLRTVVDLIDDPDVIATLQLVHLEKHALSMPRILNLPDDDEDRKVVLASIKNSQRAFAREQERKCGRNLRRSICLARGTYESAYFEGLKNFRDKVSHALSQTRLEHRRDAPITVKYGYEKKLLKTTITLIEKFYCWVNGVSFSINDDRRDFARTCAEEMWLNCKLNIPDQRA